MVSRKEIFIRKLKKIVKKMLGMDYKFKISSFDEKNYSKSLSHLLSHRTDLLDERKSAGIRRDKKEFYPDVKRIADAFSFYRIYLHKYDKDYPNIPEIGEYDGLHSGTPIKHKPFPMCVRYVKRLLRSRTLFWYPSTAGGMVSRQKFLEYLEKEGFKLDKEKDYDGMGIDNIVFTTSTTQAYSMIVSLIARREDVILVTGPNYGFFALEPERLNARVEILKLKEEDNWYVNKDDLASRIDEINNNLKKEFKGKLDYVPRVVGFLNMNPHNPLGKVMNKKNKEMLEGIGDVCLEKGVFVIDDLIYRDLTFDTDDLALPLATYPKYFNNTISLFGISKAYGLASFRAGVIVAPIPVCRGISGQIFQLMDSTPVVQVESVVGAFNASKKRYKEYKKYFTPLIKEYKYRYQLFKAMVEGIDKIEDKHIKNKIIRDIYHYEKDENIRKMLLEGIPNVSIRKNTEPESGFFAVMDFTKLKGKKYGNKVIKNDCDMLEYFYIKGKIVYIMGMSVSWPNEDEIIGRINFALTKKALINNMKILTTSVRELR